MGVKGALQAVDGGVLLDVDVKPAAQEDRFPDGYDEWRERIGARVQARAEDGQANRALCEVVAATLDVDADRVGIRRGHTSRRKTLLVADAELADVASVLGNEDER